MTTIETILTVPLVTALLIAAARRLWPSINGAWTVLTAATVAGALVSSALQWWPYVVAWLDARPWVGVPARGAVAAALAMGAVDMLRGLAARLAPVSVDARTVRP